MAQLLYACLLLLLLEPAALAQCPPETIEDVCQQSICSGCEVGDLFPDLEDCHRFYACKGDGDPVLEPALCPDGQVFNYSLQDCQEPSADIPCPPCTLTKECVYECPDEEGISVIAYSEDCSFYYECSDGSPTIKHCNDDLKPFFDGTICQADQTLCCSCQPSCDEYGVYLIIDPIDCRKFWLCDTTTPAPEPRGPLFNAGTPKSRPEYSGTCDEGEVFESNAKACMEGAPCVTECRNVVNATGCTDPFICLTTGTFPKCKNQCVQEYYDCEEVTNPDYKDPDLCPTGLVFNPDSHLCINPDDCPYLLVPH